MRYKRNTTIGINSWPRSQGRRLIPFIMSMFCASKFLHRSLSWTYSQDPRISCTLNFWLFLLNVICTKVPCLCINQSISTCLFMSVSASPWQMRVNMQILEVARKSWCKLLHETSKSNRTRFWVESVCKCWEKKLWDLSPQPQDGVVRPAYSHLPRINSFAALKSNLSLPSTATSSSPALTSPLQTENKERVRGKIGCLAALKAAVPLLSITLPPSAHRQIYSPASNLLSSPLSFTSMLYGEKENIDSFQERESVDFRRDLKMEMSSKRGRKRTASKRKKERERWRLGATKRGRSDCRWI